MMHTYHYCSCCTTICMQFQEEHTRHFKAHAPLPTRPIHIHLPHRLLDADLQRVRHESFELLRHDTRPCPHPSRCRRRRRLATQVLEDIRRGGVVAELDLFSA